MIAEVLCAVAYLFTFYILFWKRQSQKKIQTSVDQVDCLSLSERDVDTQIWATDSCRPWINFVPIQSIAFQNQLKALKIQSQASKMYGLQIGINYIQMPKHALSGCINDSLNFRALLLANQVPAHQLELMTDFTNDLPTKANILSSISSLLQRAPNGSSILISFSGHGLRSEHRNWVALGSNGSAIDLIIGKELFQIISPAMAEKPQSKLMIVSDSCFSENVANLKYTYYPNSSNTQVLNEINKDSKETSGTIFVISGSNKNQPSIDAEFKHKLVHGAMTYNLLQFLQTNRLRTFTYRNWILSINKMLRSKGFNQISCLSSSIPLPLDQEMMFP